jgi:hypothetical protein
MDSSKLRRRIGRPGLIAIGVAVLLVSSVIQAYASHPEASLPGSNFEIDTDANLKVDDPALSIDWANVTEIRRTDAPTGQNDDSYKGGVKEDTACPGEVTGSIPNNKSDLLSFGAYVEPETGGPGFLNLFWSRVADPSGTTLMDFELNHSATPCGVGPNVVRTAGDLLIEYAIDQGGAVAKITVREWTGSAWGPATDLTGSQAAGTINSSPIPAAQSDGLISTGQLNARTFGEAQLDLDFIFDEGTCESFGSAMLKSRSSDAFTSQLKDFIRPVGVNITNCGSVIIRKVTDPTSDPATTQFGYTKDFDTDPPGGANTFSLGDGESTGTTFVGNVLFGADYTVDETTLPTGWDFVSVDCSASTGVTPDISGSEVTFDIDNSADILDCTYTNRARATIIVEKITDDGFGAFDFTSNTLTPASFTLTTTSAGDGGKDSRSFSDLVPGTYDVAETVPAGWDLVSSSCDDGSDPDTIGLSAGETVTCTFHDARETGAIVITKTRKHAAGGSVDQPHPGVTFTITGGELPAAGVTAVTDSSGVACVDGLVLSSLVGDYTVTETVPTGYVADGLTSKTVPVTAEATCLGGGGNGVSFSNTPLTNVTVSVDSQVDGGTSSTIDCGPAGDTTTGPDGDGSLVVNDLLPTAPDATLVCTITIDP